MVLPRLGGCPPPNPSLAARRRRRRDPAVLGLGVRRDPPPRRSDFSAGALSLGRLVVGSIALGAVAVSRGLPRPSGRDWVGLVVIGVLWFGVYNLALNRASTTSTPAPSAMLIQISPVLIALLATLFLGERFTVLARRSGCCWRSPASC